MNSLQIAQKNLERAELLLERSRKLILEDLMNKRDHYESVEDLMISAFFIGRLTDEEVINRLSEIIQESKS